MRCNHCKNSCIKWGYQKYKQRFYCKKCNKSHLDSYTNLAYSERTNEKIKLLVKESAGIRSISRILKISPTTIMKRILFISRNIQPDIRSEIRKEYEMDELWTFIKNKKYPIWIVYALERENKAIIDFKVGNRNSENLGSIVNKLIGFQAKRIYTDKLNIYPGIIPSMIHKAGGSYTRKIERFNLNLRTHLKRLSRKTICFSKSIIMLEACLRIYFWG